jgi:transcriptional regulator with XRE-family HTH domain
MADILLPSSTSAMTISSDERAFFVAMGERIASLRKARNLTQTQLAYEAGSRRIPVSALPTVARTLSVSLMVLFGQEQEKAASRRRGPVPQWQQHIEAIARLPRSRQQFVSEMLRNALGEGAAR